MKTHRLIALAAVGLFWAASVSALVRAVDFPELARSADSTVVVKVVNSYGDWNDAHNLIFTHYVVDLERHIAGRQHEARFELRFAGGTAPDGKQIVASDVPELQIGQRYLLFLSDLEQPYAAPVVGRWQGIFKIVEDASTRQALLVDVSDHVIETDSEGRIVRGATVNIERDGRLTAKPEPPVEAAADEPVLTAPDGQILPLAKLEARQMSLPIRQPIDLESFLTVLSVHRPAEAPVAE